VVIGLLAEPYSFRHAAFGVRLNGRAPGLRAMFSIDTTLPDLCGGGLVVRPDGRAVGILGLDLLPEAWENAEPGNLLSLFGSANQGQRPGYQMVYPAATFASLVAVPPPLDETTRRRRAGSGSRCSRSRATSPSTGASMLPAASSSTPSSRDHRRRRPASSRETSS
jgi:hypothetical protein